MDGAESVAARWRRRAFTFPLLVVLGAATLALLPLLLGGALLVDLARGGRLARVRLVAFAPVYLLAELAGLAASLAVWLAFGPWRRGDPARFLAANFRLQGIWAGALLAAIRRIFGLRFVVEGDAEIAPGPLLVFARHASLADVLLPAVLVAARHRLRLRWVLKRELLVDPCLDVVGSRLPNVFVDRSAIRSAGEIAAVARLAGGLGSEDGVLIYPEGTRFSPAKQQRAFERIAGAGSSERLGRLRGLRHLLPPRTGGPLALLAAAPGADVLLLGHAGLDGLAELHILSGGRVGSTVAVRFWRHAAAAVPREREQALAWLDERWCELDGWVHERLAAAGAPG